MSKLKKYSKTLIPILITIAITVTVLTTVIYDIYYGLGEWYIKVDSENDIKLVEIVEDESSCILYSYDGSTINKVEYTTEKNGNRLICRYSGVLGENIQTFEIEHNKLTGVTEDGIIEYEKITKEKALSYLE